MAIVQISRITHRKGLYENLPQLAGGELGWAIDEQKLFIGNGTLTDGAPIVGNTEILTEHSDILSIFNSYTYKGEVASPLDANSKAVVVVQTGSTPTNPVTRTIQSKLDDFASVKDFGAVGDGVVDDTDAINRALNELFTNQNNEEIRRSLFFPAGVYLVTGTILIPSYAKIYGEGKESTIIRYASPDSTIEDYVVKTVDSLQQSGVNIATNGAVRPQYIEVSSLSFETTEQMSVLLVEKSIACNFDSVRFAGPLTQDELRDDFENTSAITVVSSSSLVTQDIIFDKCTTTGTTYGLYIDYNCEGVTFSNGRMQIHHRGVSLGASPVNSGPTGVRVFATIFDDIYVEGIFIGDVINNVSSMNLFLDVANHFNGSGNPAVSVININNVNNISFGDMFARDDTDNLSQPRIELNDLGGIAFDGGKSIRYGNYERSVSLITALADNVSTPTAVVHEVLDIDLVYGFRIEYSLSRDSSARTGTIIVAPDQSGSNTPIYNEDYVESGTTGVTFTISQVTDKLYLNYTTTSTGQTCNLNYSIVKFLR